MKIRYASDLHIEFEHSYTPGTLPSIGEDLVVLAGDISVGTDGIQWAAQAFRGRPVVYVLGNHEFYGQDFDDFIRKAREAAGVTDNVYLLERDVLLLPGGARVLGCTLWTDFELHGVAERSMMKASEYMVDYRAIRCGMQGWLAPQQTRERCQQSRAWLAEQLAASDQPTIVVTHMAPSGHEDLVNPQFGGQDPLTPAFASAFDDLIAPPVDAWIFGHHHHSLDTEMNGVRIVSNQRGYPGEDIDFDWERTIYVPAVPSWSAMIDLSGMPHSFVAVGESESRQSCFGPYGLDPYFGAYLRLHDEPEDPREREKRLHRICAYAILVGEDAYDEFEAELFRVAAAAIADDFPAAATRLEEAARGYPPASTELHDRVMRAIADTHRLGDRLAPRLYRAIAR